MKTKVKIGAALLFFALASTTLTAQTDSVAVIQEKEPTVVRDTVVKYEKREWSDKLHHGEFGIRYMPTFVAMSFRNSNGDVIQGDVTMSNGVGIMMGANFTKHVGIVGEVNYLDITQKYRDRNLDRQVNVSYLNIPVMLSLNTNKTKPVNLNFVVGPQFGLNIGGNVSANGNGETETVNATLGASGTDVGAAYGAGLEIALNRARSFRIDLGYRGSYGIVDGRADKVGPSSYNVLVKGSRKTNAGYMGFAWTF